MFKKVTLSLFLFGLVMAPGFVLAQDKFGIRDAVRGTSLIGSNAPVSAAQTLPALIGSIIAIILSLVGILFFLLVLYAGITWMTAFGNSEKVDKAKAILEHAAIGLAIVLAAYAISTFVFNRINDINNGEQAVESTQAQEAGQSCGENSVWNNSGNCVSECEYTRAGVCQDRTISCPNPYETGLCPGASNIQCCSQTPL